MCLIVFAWRVNAEIPLAVSANRDEFYERPSLADPFWEDHPEIFAGRDLLAGGTWMGLGRAGRFAALTNIRNPSKNNPAAESRGQLVSDFLAQDISLQCYAERLEATHQRYNGFNLLFGDREQLVYFNSDIAHCRSLEAGVYALSNAQLDTPWPKTRSATLNMKRWLAQPGDAASLAALLSDRSLAADCDLPETGIADDLERALSAQFIDIDGYGTRCSTGIAVHRSGTAEFFEQSFEQGQATLATSQKLEGFRAPLNQAG